MSEDLTPVAANTTVQAPLSGERASAGVLRDISIQPLLNRIEYQRVTREAAEASIIQYTPGLSSYTLKVVPVEWGVGSDTVWLKTLFTADGSAFAEQTADDDGQKYCVNITPLLPRYGRISKIGCELYGASGHGAMPVRPRVGLYRVATVHAYNATWTSIDEDADQSVDVAAYQTPHALSRTLPTPHTFDIINYKYQLRITGESGANYVAGLRILGLRFEIINAA